MTIIRLDNHLTVVFSDNKSLSTNTCTDDLLCLVNKHRDDEELVKTLLVPGYFKKKEEYELKKDLISDYANSKLLTLSGQSIYITSVSELTVPEDLALAILNAEKEGNDELVNSYINFWTLVSINPDSRARTNLFWFLQKYGMQISASGLFVAYRNVVLKKDGNEISEAFAKAISKCFTKVKYTYKKKPSNYVVIKTNDGYELAKKGEYDNVTLQDLYTKLGEENAPIYTDAFTESFTIKIGVPVMIDRKDCDPNQNNTCSKGLHVAGKDWLDSNYFGKISLKVLVNPADVVAVPPSDGYGKMRVCAYYPVEILDRDEDGNLINEHGIDGFEDDFIDMISYSAEVNNQDDGKYSVNIPEMPELNRNNILNRLNFNIKDKVSIHEDYDTQEDEEDYEYEGEDDGYGCDAYDWE